MQVLIRKYNPEQDYNNIRSLIQAEGEEWADYLVPQYESALKNSTTHVASVDGEICGYVRTMNDNGISIWIMDLLVDKHYRGKGIGKQLMDRVCETFPNQEIYVLSDVDPYYEKLGFKNEGTIFRVSS